MSTSTRTPQTFVPTANIIPLVDDNYLKDSPTGKVFGKVEGYLKDYAESIGTTPRKLMVKEVFDQAGEIHPKFMRFIDKIPRLPKQTEKRWKSYRSEIRANVRNLSKNLYGIGGKKARKRPDDDLLLKRVPEALKVVLPYLPRQSYAKKEAKDKRLRAPLTDTGVVLLSAILNTWERNGLTTCEELFVGSVSDLYKEIRKLSASANAETLISRACNMSRWLGFEKPKPELKAVELDKWPPTLRREWEKFRLLAEQGVTPEMAVEAKEGKYSVKKLVKTSFAGYEVAVGRALWVIRPEGDMGLLDLIRVVPREGSEPGDGKPKEHNHLVDIFRASERAKRGRNKAVGFDSGQFEQFVTAIKSAAARNGYGRHIKQFSEAYPVCLDDEAKEGHKRAKKAGIPLKWVDEQIAKLHKRFEQIVKSGSFKRTPGRYFESRRNLLLVMFFTWLVTLRYMGYRQQCLVNCVLGVNFIFNPDGSITLRFDKTKNRKRIRMDLNESRRRNHGLLWDTLTLYYKKVYPYLVRESGDTLRGQLFVRPTRGRSFRPFKQYTVSPRSSIKEGTEFHRAFCRARDLFMNVDDLEPAMRRLLHPHFLRGLCTDWMVLVLKMTCEQAAEVLGINTEVLEKEYLQQDREHDAGVMFDIVNARERAEQANGELHSRINDVLEKVDKTQEKIVAEKDRQIEALQAEVASLRARQQDPFS